MKKIKKIVALSLTVLMTASLATGCSSKATSSNGNTNVPKKVQLKVFMTFPRFQTQIEKYFDQFKAKEKAEKNIDVDIKLEMPNSDQASQILKSRLASNDSPDLFTIQANSDIETYYKSGYLSDLSSQPFVSSLYDSVKKTVTYNNKVVALPLESVTWGYLYNKKMFSDLGITPPQTLDEMKAVVAKLKENKITPFELAFQESWVPQLMTALSLGGVVSSQVPDWVDKMNQGKASYNDVKDIFNIIDLIMANGTAKPFEVGGQTGSADFANGKAAMWIQGNWQADAILKVNPNFQLGCAPLPVSNDKKGTLINLATSTALALSPKTKNKAVASDLLNYMLDSKDSSALFSELKFNPVASFMTYKTFPWTEEASTYVSQGRAYQDLKLPNSVTSEQAKMLQSYYSKEVTKDAMIKDLDKAYETAVKSSK